MAKRRLNTKFIGILTGSVAGAVVLGFGGIYAKRHFFHEKPDKYLAVGKAALAAKDYEKARDNLMHAAGLMPPDPSLDVMIGDALNGLTYKEPDYVAAARHWYEQASAVDPTYVPALERLVTFWQDDLDLSVRPADRASSADNLGKAAAKLIEVDPKNFVGRRAMAESTIEDMLDGRPTPPSKLNDAEEELLNLSSAAPKDANLPYWAARSRLHQAVEAWRAEDAAGADSDLRLAQSIMLDAEKQEPDDAFLVFRTGQILLQTANAEQSMDKPLPEIASLVNRANSEVARARTLVKPDDSQYVEINLYDAMLVLDDPDFASAATQPTATADTNAPPNTSADANASPAVAPGQSVASGQNAVPAIPENSLVGNLNDAASSRHATADRVEHAERIYQDVLAHRKDSAVTRLAYARLLGDLPGHRTQAIDLLKQPFVADGTADPGMKGTLLPVLQAEADTRLLGLELDELDATRDKAKRDALIAQCIPLSDRITGKSPDSPAAMGLRGRLELAQGKLVEATQSLRRALALIDTKNVALTRTRYEMMFYLARAYEEAQQTGEAEKLAGDVVSLYTQFIPARLMLARLLIGQRNFDAAKPQIDFLASMAPTNPQLAGTVQRMRLACIDPAKDPAKYRELYDQLPEKTRDEEFDKARIAHDAKMDDDAIRLLTDICGKTPGDAQAAEALAGIYASRNQMDRAQQTINAAVAAKPSDVSLLTMQMRLAGKSQDQIDAELQRLGAAPADQLTAFLQEIRLANNARLQGDGAAEDRHLEVAQKLKPDDPRLWNALFMRDLQTAHWDQAQALLDKLSANDVDHAGGVLYRIRLAMAQNDLAKAEDLAVKLTRDKPEFSQSWCLLGDVQRAAGKYDDAVHSYQFALERQVENADARKGIIQCAYAMDRPDAAEHYIEEARKIDPSNPEFKEMDLNHELTYGDPQKVIGPRLDAVKATPSDPMTWLNLAATYSAAAEARTVARDPAGTADFVAKAEQTLRDGTERFPDDERFPLAFSKIALANHDFADAEPVMLALVARPKFAGQPRTAIVLSDFYSHAGKPDQAIAVLRQYLAKPATTPEGGEDVIADVNVQLRLSKLLGDEGKTDEALAVLVAHPDQPSIVAQRIGMMINANRLVDADKALALEAVKGPLSPQLQNLRGVLDLAEHQPAAAAQTFDQILATHPDDVEALTHRAQMALNDPLPNYRQASADLSHARDVDPRNTHVRLALAQIDRKEGRPQDAAKELEAGLRAAPGDKELRLTLVDLYASQQLWDDATRVLHAAALIPELADDADLIHAQAVVALGRGNLAAALQSIQDAMSRQPQNLAMVRTYYDILLKQKSAATVLSHSDQLLASHPNDSSLWWVFAYRAQARMIDGSDRSGAADELARGLAMAEQAHDDGGSTQLMHKYSELLGVDSALAVAQKNARRSGHWQLIAASLCQDKDDLNGAGEWLDMALEHFDTLGSADQDAVLRRAAFVFERQSPPDLKKSAEMYRRLIALNPNDIDVLNNLACLLAEPGPTFQPKEALDYGEQAYNAMTRSGSDSAMIKDTYGWTLIANGKADQGYSLVEDALSQEDFAEGHYHLAEALLKRTPPDSDDAVSELTKAIRLLDDGERQGKPTDDMLKTRIEQELRRARAMLTG